MSGTIELPEKLRPFNCHGVDLAKTSGDQYRGPCPFCEGNKFYANCDGQYDCKHCGESGNHFTFLTKYAALAFGDSSEQDLRRLADDRGIEVATLRYFRVGYDGEQYLIPVAGPNRHVNDIRRYRIGEKLKSTNGCKIQLFNLPALLKAAVGSHVYVCEGEWDAMAMHELLADAGEENCVVVAVPGAGTFKAGWVDLFRGRDCVLCFDNDEAGRNGQAKVVEKLSGVARSIRVIEWPEDVADGFDVRDFSLERRGRLTSKEIIDEFKRCLIEPATRTAPVSPVAAELPDVDPELTPSFDETIEEYRKWATLKESDVDVLKVMFAVTLSARTPGDPLWMFVVGPPGSGKTLMLSSLGGSPRASVYSTITPKALVSGYQQNGDPSLLPRFDGFCVVWKDFTELLNLYVQDRMFVFATLRGAYDGEVVKPFGNGVTRRYKLRFAMLAGVTHAIHGINDTALGERFLRIQLEVRSGADEDEQIDAAMTNVDRSEKVDEATKAAAERFLARHVDPDRLPSVPASLASKIKCLSRLIARMRATVDRQHFGDREVSYRPQPEIGTRLAKQLIKLLKMLAVVSKRDLANDEDYRIVHRVAFDTAAGFGMDIVEAIRAIGGAATVKELNDRTGISTTSIRTRLQDMKWLKIVDEFRGAGPTTENGKKPANLWRIADEIEDLWQLAAPIRRSASKKRSKKKEHKKPPISPPRHTGKKHAKKARSVKKRRS